MGSAEIHVSAHFSVHISSVTVKYLTEQKMFGTKVVETNKLHILPSILLFISISLNIFLQINLKD
jgi:hypothetical protein